MPSETLPALSTAPVTSSATLIRVEQILTPFTLEFDIFDNRQYATLSDLEALESLTSEYLRTHFFGISFSSNDIMLEDLFTEIVTHEDSPEASSAMVTFRSTLVFDADSPVIPTQSELEDALESAVSGEDLNGFLGMIQAIPIRYLFSSTTQIAFLGYDYGAETASHTVIIPRSKSSIASLVWASTMVALATSLVSLAFYFRLSDHRRHGSNNKRELANLVELKAAPRTETSSSVAGSGGDIMEGDDDDDSRLSELLPFRDHAPKTSQPKAIVPAAEAH